jgi:CPA2 family monovalent cation:H+ antiporter-2
MSHETPLVILVAGGLSLAFVFALVAHRFRLSPLVGYLVAGIAIGPFTPGMVGDQHLAQELAEIGVILLMFGVGLHFSVADLLSVRRIAIPGAVVQMAVATLFGALLGQWLGWDLVPSVIFGLALSVASTVVLLKALQGHGLVTSDSGRIAVGWLIVEDLAMVLALVLVPVAAIADDSAGSSGLVPLVAATLAKVVGFIAFMLIVGRRVIPALLHHVAHLGSRELFRLAVLAIALGVALGASVLFNVSFALGAFFAGMILAESELSHRAAEETLPLRDAFAVLFFVSAGMLFNPAVLMEQPAALLATLGVIVAAKAAAAFVLLKLLGQPRHVAALVAASLAQIGEFSFILASLGTGLGLLPNDARDLIMASAILSILLNPLLFSWAARLVPAAEAAEAPPAAAAPPGHAIIIGYGRVGRAVAAGLGAQGRQPTVIEHAADRARHAEADGHAVVLGHAGSGDILARAGIARASHLFVSVSDGFESGQIVVQARKSSPTILIIAASHSHEESRYLRDHGVNRLIESESEVARAMLASA